MNKPQNNIKASQKIKKHTFSFLIPFPCVERIRGTLDLYSAFSRLSKSGLDFRAIRDVTSVTHVNIMFWKRSKDGAEEAGRV